MEFSGRQRSLSNRSMAMSRRRASIQRRALTKAKMLRMLRGNTFVPPMDPAPQAFRKYAPITLRFDADLEAATSYNLDLSNFHAACIAQTGLPDTIVLTLRIKSMKGYLRSNLGGADTSNPVIAATIFSLHTSSASLEPTTTGQARTTCSSLAEVQDEGTLNMPARIGFKYPVDQSLLGLTCRAGDRFQTIIRFSGTARCSASLYFDCYYSTRSLDE